MHSSMLFEPSMSIKLYISSSPMMSNKKIQINQPIVITDIIRLLNGVNGVQAAQSANITLKSGGDYSIYKYNIKQNITDEILYPSIDPMIFEVKFPDEDIQGEAV